MPEVRFCSACGAELESRPPVTCSACGVSHYANPKPCANAIVAKDAPRKPAAAAKPALPRRRTVVRVLNGNGRTGAAAAAASRVRGKGYRIGFVGNAPRTDFAQSLVMYKPGFAGEARRFARDLHLKHAIPLDGMRPRELGRAHVVFILGA